MPYIIHRPGILADRLYLAERENGSPEWVLLARGAKRMRPDSAHKRLQEIRSRWPEACLEGV